MTDTHDFVQTKRLASTFTRMVPDTSNLGAYRKGTIVSIQDGPPRTCTITLSGDPTQISSITFIDSYVPVVGDTVILGKQAGSLLILGTVEDRPPAAATLMLSRNATQSISSGVDTAISWDTKIRTIGGPASWWSSGDPTAIVCPWVGVYLVTVNIAWAQNATGYRVVRLNQGSTLGTSNYIANYTIKSTEASEAAEYSFITKHVDVATAGQVYKIAVWQNTGGALNLAGQYAQKPASCSFTYLGRT